ncbi:MAG TPA: Lsr2 family protein [Microbacterium sp.]|nr:Lsr2 family protein [Microbacterium sp.]
MAKKIIHQLVDDLDGSVLEPGVGETVLFSLDGRAYEIDLTDEHAAALRDALSTYIAAGRSVGREATVARSAAPRRRVSRGSATANAAVRAWANQNGFTVSERGRIPASVQEAYEAAH